MTHAPSGDDCVEPFFCSSHKKKRILTADPRCASNDFIIKRENIARNKNIIFEFLQKPSINYQALDVTHSWSINTQKAARESRWLVELT